MADKELAWIIRKYALKNAFDFGKASEGAVIGKAMQYAKNVPVGEIRALVQSTVKEVNAIGKEELKKEYSKYADEFEQKAKETAEKTAKPKMELEGAVVGKFVTRFPPEPSGYMHIGHAKPIFMEQEFTKMYKGKLFLYFDDTNPEKEALEFVEADKRDLEWLGIKFDGEYYASDNLDAIYDYAKKLIKGGNAYVCFCEQETMKEGRLAQQECEHRKAAPERSMSEFNKMLAGEYEDGAAVLRFKGSMKSDNTALRDPTIARLKSAKHYRQGNKYRVWPTYDLAAPINDSANGVTHVLRSKEYELRDELDTKILEALGMRVPAIVPFSRLNVQGNTTHKREIRKMITEGIIKSWDDPRLMTFAALRRRGILPDAIRNFVMRMGLTKTDSNVPLEMLMAENKKIIDQMAKHLYFVPDPVKMVVSGAAGLRAKLKLHPSKDYGFREYDTKDTFYISKEDAAELEERASVRLKDLIEVRLLKKGKAIEAVKEEADNGKVVQWVAEGSRIECTVLIPLPLIGEGGKLNPGSLKSVSGYVEAYAEKLKEHEIVQFERFGYCILDDKKKMQFIFITK